MKWVQSSPPSLVNALLVIEFLGSFKRAVNSVVIRWSSCGLVSMLLAICVQEYIAQEMCNELAKEKMLTVQPGTKDHGI